MVPNPVAANAIHEQRPLEDVLEIVAHLVYLARNSPSSTEYYLVLAAEEMEKARQR